MFTRILSSRNNFKGIVNSSINFNNLSKIRKLSGGVEWHGTTILCVRKNGLVVMAGDGQVSMG